MFPAFRAFRVPIPRKYYTFSLKSPPFFIISLLLGTEGTYSINRGVPKLCAFLRTNTEIGMVRPLRNRPGSHGTTASATGTGYRYLAVPNLPTHHRDNSARPLDCNHRGTTCPHHTPTTRATELTPLHYRSRPTIRNLDHPDQLRRYSFQRYAIALGRSASHVCT